MTRGGKREGAGRPKQDATVTYFRRVKPEWVKELDKVLNDLKTACKKNIIVQE
jgi:hypothetical protein